MGPETWSEGESQTLREGSNEIEIAPHVTATGPRLRIRSLRGGHTVDLDPLELEGLTRLPFTPFAPLDGTDFGEERRVVTVAGLRVLRNEFAMVGVGMTTDSDRPRLRVCNMGSGAEVKLGASQLARLAALHHRDLAPLIDPSGLAAGREPEPDQV